ncbi:MAG: serine hydrolase [Clostridiales bacterium]|nr:serine hydrolase [Clostridiales bacterium]
MKNPKSNYIGEARRIRRTRMIIRGIIAGAVILVVAFAIFFAYILRLKSDIDTEFSGTTSTRASFVPSSESSPGSETEDPELGVTTESGAISSNSEPSESTDPLESTDPSETSETDETEETEESVETSTVYTSEGDDTDPSDPEDTTATTTISLLPDEWIEPEPVLFPEKYPLQTVTHAERDQSFANLKHAVKKYIEEHSEVRIGFYYINLNTSEAFGYNESSPFVVGSSIYLPLTMMYYDDVRAGKYSPDMVVPFHPSYVQEDTETALAELPDEKQFYMYQLVYLALRDGDSVAMNMILDHMGDKDALWKRLSQMTSCIDFTSVQNYTDFQGIQQSGEHRSSAYDLASYAQMLYWRYMSYPYDYQDLINALSSSDQSSGVARYFPSDSMVLHRSGSNSEFNSESDVAIILSYEPVVICVTVEAATPEAAKEIQAALGALVYNFISYCHA